MDRKLRELRQRIDERLEFHLQRSLDGGGKVLVEAANEAALGRGKRMRPLMAMLACDYFGAAAERALDFGCAVELVHAASLVLDDLPCMDDAIERRGTAPIHRHHGEDAAVLAAVAMIAEAQRIVVTLPDTSAATRLAVAECLARSLGLDGLAQGQIRDLRASAKDRSEDGLRTLNHLKTGVLFEAAVRGGSLIAGVGDREAGELASFARDVGFAFQLVDDLDDRADACLSSASGQRNADTFDFVTLWGAKRVRDEVAASLYRAGRNIDVRSKLYCYVMEHFASAGLGQLAVEPC